MTRGSGPGWKTVIAAAAALLCTAGPVRAEATRLYYERSLMIEAHARCNLFDPATAGALEAAARQARGAALRAGSQEGAVHAVRARAARTAAAAPCDGADLTTAAQRVRQGFEGWTRTPRMTFIGADGADWIADRTERAHAVWRLRQEGRFRGAHAVLGLSAAPGADAAPAAVISFPGRPRPYAARILMRDPDRAHRPWLVQASLSPLPPVDARRAFWAASSEPAPRELLPAGRRQGELWRFSNEMMEALSRLDPRERFTVEFLFRDDSVVRVHMLVGDLDAARAFTDLGAP